ncbi:MAG: hypothetical protein QXF46_04115 [Thermofilaceae archaeon]
MREGRLLIILYEVPEEPSRFKVRIWRKLRGLGGVYPRLSLCLLPDTREVREALEGVVREIREHGTAIVLEGRAAGGEDALQLRSVLAALKEREYREILEECDEFLNEIRENIEKGNVTQEEAEELEEILEALEKWYQQVRSTDWIGVQAGSEVEKKLKECEKALEEFTSLCLRNLKT